MSEARWCDPGAHAFGVMEDGWETYTASRSFKDATGRRRVETYQGDMCAKHASGTGITGGAIEASVVDLKPAWEE